MREPTTDQIHGPYIEAKALRTPPVNPQLDYYRAWAKVTVYQEVIVYTVSGLLGFSGKCEGRMGEHGYINWRTHLVPLLSKHPAKRARQLKQFKSKHPTMSRHMQLRMHDLGKLPRGCPHYKWLRQMFCGEWGEFQGVRFVEEANLPIPVGVLARLPE